jgi:putative endonuclease
MAGLVTASRVYPTCGISPSGTRASPSSDAIPIPETLRVKQFYVYFLASRPGGALYVGVTNDLVRRVYEHKNGMIDGFSKRYGIDRLVYFEVFDSSYAAIQREKNIKHWPRTWKTRLIAQNNPTWRDLYADIAGAT